MTPEDELPQFEGVQYAPGEEYNSRKNEAAGSKGNSA